MKETPSNRELDVLAAWWLTGSVKRAGEVIGVGEQTAKNLLNMARLRFNCPDNQALVVRFWGLLPRAAKRLGIEDRRLKYRNLRYIFDPEYRERTKATARKAVTKFREKERAEQVAIHDHLIEHQGNACAICGRPGQKRRLAVDRDHATGAIRGLLCASCNMMLGNAKDVPELLEIGAAYLRANAESTSHNTYEAVA